MIKRVGANESGTFRHLIAKLNLPGPRHQISSAFTDGITGYGLICDSAYAVVVGDFVELTGDYDPDLYREIGEIEEAHLMEPPRRWVSELKNDHTRRIREYERTAFFPMRAREQKETAYQETRISIDAKPVEIARIDQKVVVELLSERWSADIVRNTMAEPKAKIGGFGFVARHGPQIVGGIGCYTVYRDGIEIEIDTHADYRRRGIATALGRKMIVECAKRGLDCHWDAMNEASAVLARKLGFVEERTYRCIEVSK